MWKWLQRTGLKGFYIYSKPHCSSLCLMNKKIYLEAKIWLWECGCEGDPFRYSLSKIACEKRVSIVQLPQISFPSNLSTPHHDYQQAKQAHYLRKPVQRCVIHILFVPGYYLTWSIILSEGVLVAKKDFNASKHEELDVPNLEVIKAMQSLTSKNLVKTQFSWQWYYYTLTTEGVNYLREWYVSIYIVFALD